MKFAKDLDNELVPEWREKYLNYKLGKKKIKAVARAHRAVNPLKTPKPKFTPDAKTSPSRTPFLDIRPGNGQGRGIRRYGSIIASPPSPPLERVVSLNLGEPAIETPNEESAQEETEPQESTRDSDVPFPSGLPQADSLQGPRAAARPRSASVNNTHNAFEVGPTVHPHHSTHSIKTTPSKSQRALLRSLFTRHRSGTYFSSPHGDISLDDWKEIGRTEKEFLDFLHGELEKIETFYAEKENLAIKRLDNLKQQLHHLRDQRAARHEARGSASHEGMLHQTAHVVRRDYVPRVNVAETPYRSAKRKLKLAMEDYYRGLEYLKSYGELNAKAFRKINKKFDKAVTARPALQFFNKNVKTAHFVKSDLPDEKLQEVEDIYARYFEAGNHKVAVSKLRRRRRTLDASPDSSFRNGVLLSIAIISGVNGLIGAVPRLDISIDPIEAVQTSYLLQLYGGYFLMTLLMLLFCMACRIWKAFRINYQLVFEFDQRSQLDWTQLTQFPLLFMALLGVTMWCNFSSFGDQTDLPYIYWPVILIGLTAILLFMPLPILYHKSRRWFAESMFRLWFLSGLSSVQFRDFFLGDMFCSQTYAMGNIELFFCLYAHRWSNPAACNSSNSRLLGFFQALPGIWRMFQCFRRIKQSSELYRLLNSLNAGKYGFTIASQALLSVYRINRSPATLAAFITVSAINTIYTATWDVMMDWSLINPVRGGLRKTLAFSKHRWVYYVALVVDPLLRCNWIPYAVLRHDYQHSAITSFAIALSEVLRRGMWLILRVENEHCTNVKLFRAQQDRALPYDLSSPLEREHRDADALGRAHPSSSSSSITANGAVESRAEEAAAGRTPPMGTPSSLMRMGTVVATTHAQDFVRRRTTFPQRDESDEDEEEEEEEDDDASMRSGLAPSKLRLRNGGKQASR